MEPPPPIEIIEQDLEFEFIEGLVVFTIAKGGKVARHGYTLHRAIRNYRALGAFLEERMAGGEICDFRNGEDH